MASTVFVFSTLLLLLRIVCGQNINNNGDLPEYEKTSNCSFLKNLGNKKHDFLISWNSQVITATKVVESNSINIISTSWPLDVASSTTTNHKVVQFDFDLRDCAIYYSNLQKDKKSDVTRTIFKADISKTSRMMLFTDKVGKNIYNSDLVHQAEGFAYDWVSKQLVYSLRRNGVINVMLVRNSAIHKTIIKDLTNPSTVLVHPNRGYIFFVQTDVDSDYPSNLRNYSITRAYGNGQNLVHIANFTGKVSALAIDYFEDQVYWADGFPSVLKRSSLNGMDVQTVASIESKYGFADSIAVSKNRIYFFTVTNNSSKPTSYLHILAKNGTRVVTKQNPFIQSETKGIKLYGPETQMIKDHHPCSRNNGGCTSFCFPIGASDNQTEINFPLNYQCAYGDSENNFNIFLIVGVISFSLLSLFLLVSYSRRLVKYANRQKSTRLPTSVY